MQDKHEKQHGFTLIELMITIAIVAVLITLAAPSFSEFFAKNRLKRATEEVYGLIVKAKAETVTRNTNLTVSVDGDAWCVGYADAACDCTKPLGDAS